MTDPGQHQGATLNDLLSLRARRMPRSRLLIDVTGGIAIAATALWARPWGALMFLSGGVCLASYGAWAFAERQLFDSPWRLSARAERSWRILKAAAALLGMLAFLTLIFALLGLGLGRWNS